MAQFRCIATGVPRPTIEWYYEYNMPIRNRLMNNTNNVMIVEESMGTKELLSTLTLTTTTHPDDSGNYTCRAVNIVDDYFSSALLNVLCMLYYKQRRICWAKHSQFQPYEFFVEMILWCLGQHVYHITIAKYSQENFCGTLKNRKNCKKFSPVNLSPFTVL